MLKTTQKITIEGKSVIADTVVTNFVASINSDDPTQLSIASAHPNKLAYKEHRVEARADEAAFEDYVYSIQDKMLADYAVSNN